MCSIKKLINSIENHFYKKNLRKQEKYIPQTENGKILKILGRVIHVQSIFYWHKSNDVFNDLNMFFKIFNLFLQLNFYKMCDDIILRPVVSYRIFWTTPQAT